MAASVVQFASAHLAVREPMTFHVNTVKVSQQGVYAPATFLFFSCVVAGCFFLWLVMPVLQVSDSVLACLALRAFLVVSMLMLQSESISCCCCTTSSTVMFSSAGDFWKTIGLLALIVFPGVSCCFVAFPSRVALQSMLVCYLAYGCVCGGRGPPACCTISLVVLRLSFISVMMHLARLFGFVFPLQPGQQSSCASWLLVYLSMLFLCWCAGWAVSCRCGVARSLQPF